MKYIENPTSEEKASFGELAYIDKASRERIFKLPFGESEPAMNDAKTFVKTAKLARALSKASDPVEASLAAGYSYGYFRKLCNERGIELPDRRKKKPCTAAN